MRYRYRQPRNSGLHLVTEQEHIAALIRSNDQLRAALILAGKELGKRQIVGKRHREMLRLMRDVVREDRAAVKAAKGRGLQYSEAAKAK